MPPKAKAEPKKRGRDDHPTTSLDRDDATTIPDGGRKTRKTALKTTASTAATSCPPPPALPCCVPGMMGAWDRCQLEVLSENTRRATLATALRRKAKNAATAASRQHSLAATRLEAQRRAEILATRKVATVVQQSVEAFWRRSKRRVVQNERKAEEEVRGQELLKKQMKMLQGTEELVDERRRLEVGTGATLPPLSLLEPIGTGLRSYQKIGIEWLVSLHKQNLNGILADEMGLGKTIQTIGLLAYLAEHRGMWGPHLIVVPTSVLMNWDLELKRWCPSLSTVLYHGSAKERKALRKGWVSEEYRFNVVLVSYNTVLSDRTLLRRKAWQYLVLDEAHSIKSWESQRWQVLLNFNTKHRLLLSGTPLQNNPMELWSLLHFLMPDSTFFESYEDFKELYGKIGVPTVEVAQHLHTTLRPFILRRLKCDVEKQLPKKHEKIIMCPLSRRQRALYDEYMSREETRNTLSSSNALGILAVLMALRKVCNHPALFEERPVVSPFVCGARSVHTDALFDRVPDVMWSVVPPNGAVASIPSALVWWRRFDGLRSTESIHAVSRLSQGTCQALEAILHQKYDAMRGKMQARRHPLVVSTKDMAAYSRAYWARCDEAHSVRCQSVLAHHEHDTIGLASSPWDVDTAFPWLASALISSIVRHVRRPADDAGGVMASLCPSLEQRQAVMIGLVRTLVASQYPAIARLDPNALHRLPKGSVAAQTMMVETHCRRTSNVASAPLSMDAVCNAALVRRMLFHPDKRLLQFDAGKLQILAALLPRLRMEGHKVLIFTQFTLVLDILEEFMSMHFLRYCRLDGRTSAVSRQRMVTQFNTNPRLFAFLLSTRSGGLGLNLTGGDTVIFYDSDWNPTIDLQAQDRCHRIGQTRDVTVYRLISEHTVEERILLKARQKKMLNNVVLRAGGFHTLDGAAADGTGGNGADGFGAGANNILSFFHDFDEDYNDGKGDPARRATLERMLQEVEDKEDAAVRDTTAEGDDDEGGGGSNDGEGAMRRNQSDALLDYGVAYLGGSLKKQHGKGVPGAQRSVEDADVATTTVTTIETTAALSSKEMNERKRERE
eukprot:PhM_4_TR11190/c0_g1_i1/m.64076/K11681/SWR1; helicase SWR1